MHISAGGRPSDAEIAANMARLAALGLVVHISEMDVRINNVGGSDQARLDAQRATYYSVVRVCRMEPRCEAVLLCIVGVAIPLLLVHLRAARQKEGWTSVGQLNGYTERLPTSRLLSYSLGWSSSRSWPGACSSPWISSSQRAC
jgi:hypothetical protein